MKALIYLAENSLGDVIMTIPAAVAINANGDHATMAVKPAYLKLVESQGITATLPWTSGTAWDYVLDCRWPGSPDPGWKGKVIRAPGTVDTSGTHPSRQRLNRLWFNASGHSNVPSIKAGQKSLPSVQPAGKGSLIACHVTNRMLRAWPYESWASLTRMMLAKGHQLLFLGSFEDGYNAVRLAQRNGCQLCYQQPVEVAAERMADCAGFIGTETGMSHLAAALGLPCVIIWNGPSSWIPAGKVTALQSPADQITPEQLASHF